MGILDRIVDINITRETRGIASANFSTPLIVTEDATGAKPRVATYSSAKEVADAGYTSTSVEYLSAQVHFAQDNHPPYFKVGHNDTSGAETLSEALDTIVGEDNDWYGLLLGVVSQANDYLTVGAWVLANQKFLFAGDGSGAQTISTALNGGSINKACVISNSKLRTSDVGSEALGYADVAFASTILGKQIGSYTAVYQSLNSTFVDTYTSTQMSAIFNDNSNLFHTLYGRAITEGGRVTDGNTPANGEWVDIEIGLDWLEVRMQESVFTTIINADKIPYTDEGTASLSTAVEQTLIQAKKQGLISEYTISREAVSDQTIQDKADRKYNGLSWTAVLTGAIHTVTINGTVRV